MTIQAMYNEDAERGLLGACLTDPKTFALLEGRVKPEHFMFIKHSYIWQAMQTVGNNGLSVDILTVSAQLKDSGQLDAVGDGQMRGDMYLADLTGAMPRIENAESYAKIVKDGYTRREIAKNADVIRHNAEDGKQSTEDLMATWDSVGIQLRKGESTKHVSLSESIHEHMNMTERMMNDPGLMRGIPTGFDDIDAYLGGLEMGLYIFAGRPSMGKTAFWLNVALKAAFQRKRSMLFSLEQGRDQITNRMISCLSGVDSKKISNATMNSQEYARYVRACGDLNNLNDYIIIDDKPAITPEYMRSKCYEMAYKYGDLDIIGVDYLQLMSYSGHADNRAESVGLLAEAAKARAKEFNVPVLMLAQLNRGVEQRADKRPMMSDLRESGGIEQAADVIIGLYRDDEYNPHSEMAGLCECLILKNREGAKGAPILQYDRPIHRFSNARARKVDMRDYND